MSWPRKPSVFNTASLPKSNSGDQILAQRTESQPARANVPLRVVLRDGDEILPASAAHAEACHHDHLRKELGRSSKTWTESSEQADINNIGGGQDDDVVHNREAFVQEYNKLAKKVCICLNLAHKRHTDNGSTDCDSWSWMK